MPEDIHMNRTLIIYDTTLRDGGQSEGISYTAEDKIKIAKKLDEFGVDYIEAGWPGSNPKDIHFFKKATDLEWENAKIAAFGSTRRANCNVSRDENIGLLLKANTPAVAIFGKSWDLHVTEGLRTTLEKNLQMISDSISYLKDKNKTVIYDAEHYFDGYKNNPHYALETLNAAIEAGADCLVLCDTNGGTLPKQLETIIEKTRTQDITSSFGIHAHNDSDVAVANSLLAIQQGFDHVQGTINGYGERCGNANLCSVIANAALKLDVGLNKNLNLKALTRVSRYISEITNVPQRDELPFVGNSAFAHKGGIHVSAIGRNPKTYEHIDPALIGNHQRILISDQSGRSNVIFKAEEIGLDIKGDNDNVKKIVDHLKELEHYGYQYEAADGSFEIMARKATGEYHPFFELQGAKVIIEKREESSAYSEAVCKVLVDGVIEHTAADGHGPVDALDKALRKALEPFYPSLKKLHLVDYKVRVLDSSAATASKVRVLIESADDDSVWGTVGVSENIIQASWQALVDSIRYKLLKEMKKGGIPSNTAR
jgi:2-isopropylmalate synthase